MTTNKKKKQRAGFKQVEDLRDRINTLFKATDKPHSFKQLTKKLDVRKRDHKRLLKDLTDEMVRTGKLQKLNNGALKPGTSKVSSKNTLTGRVDFVNPRFAFIISEESEEDIKVSATHLKYALDGDIVKVKLRSSKGPRPEGQVVEIVERKKNDYVGIIKFSENFAFVLPDNRKMHYDIFVPKDLTKDAKEGDKVIAQLLEYPAKDKNPVGKVRDVLGPAGNNDVEMHAIMAEYGLPYYFPDDVVKDADTIPGEITKEDINERRDMRDVTTFTIDPADAKDFDDALSVRQLENGNWEVGIHIADVTHYVRPGTIVDKEGYNRATSVYLVDRTIPMLPERLSNQLCSLRPHEDKLTFSAVFELDEQANVKKQWFGRTVIHSDHRFAYEDAQKVIDEGEGPFAEEILNLNRLAHHLRKDRFKKGAINFETVEVKFRLDEDGKPLEVIPKARKDAHKLIEDFMLLANRKVAEFVYFKKKGKEKLTMVYRIHDHPDLEKLDQLSAFAAKFGYDLTFVKGELSDTMNQLISEVEGKPEQNVLQTLAIRTMAKAKYSTEPEIHFGLAYKNYTHFTSPIRRYPDMMVHRLLAHYLESGQNEDKDKYQKRCDHSSEMEKLAADAERASIKYKQVEFMSRFQGDEFEGIVSGLTDYGIFVEMVETKCEGMVRLSELQDDFYEYDERNYRVIGAKNKRMITLGDRVKVQVIATDLYKRTIDLDMIF